jgi:hypothetical protein
MMSLGTGRVCVVIGYPVGACAGDWLIMWRSSNAFDRER